MLFEILIENNHQHKIKEGHNTAAVDEIMIWHNPPQYLPGRFLWTSWGFTVLSRDTLTYGQKESDCEPLTLESICNQSTNWTIAALNTDQSVFIYLFFAPPIFGEWVLDILGTLLKLCEINFQICVFNIVVPTSGRLQTKSRSKTTLKLDYIIMETVKKKKKV